MESPPECSIFSGESCPIGSGDGDRGQSVSFILQGELQNEISQSLSLDSRPRLIFHVELAKLNSPFEETTRGFRVMKNLSEGDGCPHLNFVSLKGGPQLSRGQNKGVGQFFHTGVSRFRVHHPFAHIVNRELNRFFLPNQHHAHGVIRDNQVYYEDLPPFS